MSPLRPQTLRDARHRVHIYLRVIRWLFASVRPRFGRRIALSATSSVVSLAAQGIALAMAADTVAQMQGSDGLDAFPGLAKLGVALPAPPLFISIVMFLAVFIAGSLLAYLGRSIAISLESDVYEHFYSSILHDLAPDKQAEGGFLEKVRVRHELESRHDLLRIVMTDARFGGVIIRLLLFNIIHVGSIVVGIAIIAVYAPVLLPFVAAFAVGGAGLMYPLNLRASRTTRALEESVPERNAIMRERVADAIASELALPVGTADDPEALQPGSAHAASSTSTQSENPLRNYLSLLENRLRVIEQSRVVTSALVGFGIALLIWAISQSRNTGVLDYSSLLVLFFGLRFVLNGFQGTMVTVTSITRFVPHVIRLRDFILDLGSQSSRQTDASAPLLVTQPWGVDDQEALLSIALDTPKVQRTRIKLGHDTVVGLLGPSREEGAAKALLAHHQTSPGLPIHVLLETAGAINDPDAVGTTPAPAQVEWVGDILRAGGLPTGRDTIIETLAATRQPELTRRGQLIPYLGRCWRAGGGARSLIVLDGDLLARMDSGGIAKACDHFAGNALILMAANVKSALANLPVSVFLLADEERIVAAIHKPGDLALAQAVATRIASGNWRKLA